MHALHVVHREWHNDYAVGIFIASLYFYAVGKQDEGKYLGYSFRFMRGECGSIPIAVALMLKGLTPGAALVLLMAGPACNLASILVVRKVLGTRTLSVYLASIVAGAIASGYIIDYLQFSGAVDFLGQLTYRDACCMEGLPWYAWLSGIVLLLLLLNALVIQPLRSLSSCW